MPRQATAAYRTTANAIAADIAAGRYGPDERLPVPRIAEEHNVSDWMVLRALHFLCDQGLVYSHSRRGYFVHPHPHTPTPGNLQEAMQIYQINCAQIARHTGVSTQTISQLVKGRRGMSTSWRKRITDAINEIRKEEEQARNPSARTAAAST